MKTIENLSVTMKFSVELSDVEVSDEVCRGLEKISEFFSVSTGEVIRDEDIIEAFDWLSNNIHSGDALDWEYEVDIED